MRARLASALAAPLLLIALSSPDIPTAPLLAPVSPPVTAVMQRAAPMARGIGREPVEDFSAAADAGAPADDPASTAIPEVEAQPVLPTPAPVPTPSPTPIPPPPAQPAVLSVAGAFDAAAERRMLVLMNASRAAGGLAPLVLDDSATAAARSHSAVESRYGYVYHDGPDGTAASRNVPACGNGWYGENTGKVWRANVDALHVEFMSEPWAPVNHRTNIMDPAFRRVGIGAVQGSEALYMTMVFCR